MAAERCENGHLRAESWDIYPYCPQDMSEPEIPVVRPRAVELAAAPSNAPSKILSSARVANIAEKANDSGLGMRRATTPSAIAVPPLPPSTGSQPERTIAASHLAGLAQKRYVVGWLIGLSGGARGESYPVRMGRNVIGRDKRSDIVIPDDQASSHHADLVFRPEERRFILMDHNSTNGTYVNEAEIEPRRDLIDKDVIRIGSHRFLFIPLCHDGFHWDDEGLLK